MADRAPRRLRVETVGPQSLRTQPGLLSTVLSSQDRETGGRGTGHPPLSWAYCPSRLHCCLSLTFPSGHSPAASMTSAASLHRPPGCCYHLGPSLDSPPHRAPPGWSLPARPRTCPPVCPLPHPGLPSIRENHGPARRPTAHPGPRLVGPPTARPHFCSTYSRLAVPRPLTRDPLPTSRSSTFHLLGTLSRWPPQPSPPECITDPTHTQAHARARTHTHTHTHTHIHTQPPDSNVPACMVWTLEAALASGLAASSQGRQLYTVDHLRFPPDPSLVPNCDCQPIPHSQHTKGSSDTPPHHDSWKQVLF